ncbi:MULTISPECIES: dolichyl-phosphate-mannose--protein mannosyltransferase [unclassified Actinotalea]|uniref:dolichyl-phosphate-mannose--protein mannosyltransferase n=1 Tax=unclassified Actinotalea TaxID=2638618 RepID=UPI0015F5C360|nr:MULTISPECIES: phospholipid carrier-dependent glycosyltransferase [unclassified Actinotalea]
MPLAVRPAPPGAPDATGATGPRPGRWHRALEAAQGWPATLAVAGVAAALRLPALDRPDVLVFDETYYVKDAWTLLHLGYEGSWPPDADEAFAAGDVDGFSTDPSYVVHPPVGKWVIALGLRLLGADDPVGWRLGTVVAGIVLVVLMTRVARRLLGSTALGVVAGLLVAVDGAAIVMSRTALLDGVLATLVMAAFAALLVDRDRARARLAAATWPPRAPSRWGPWSAVRPWRVLAGVLLGLAVGTKWSALWFVAVLGLVTVAWDASARRRAGVALWWQAALVRDALPAFVAIVPTAALTYVLTWTGWLRTSGGYGRSWAATHPGEGLTWLPDPLRALAEYHRQNWTFHTGLSTDHPYESSPLGWLVQWRPTSFFYDAPEPAQQACGAARCAQAVTSLGNPLVWWLGAAAVVACAWWVVRWADGVAAVALAGLAAGWLPWFAYPERTIFTFYTIVMLPWLVLCLTWAAARALAWARDEPRRSIVRTLLVAAAILVVVTTAFFWPVWTGEVITFRSWQLRQWLPDWP